MFVIPDFRQNPKSLDAQGKKQKIKQVKGFGLNLLLVEMAVIETASEKPSQGLSTSVSHLLTFPPNSAGAQAQFFSSRVMLDRLRGTPLFTFTAV